MIVWLACSGTGGHIVPALNLAAFLTKLGHKVVWIGASGMEQKLVKDYEMVSLPMKPIRGSRLLNMVMLPIDMTRSIVRCARLYLKYKPDLVCLMGSYVTFPVGIWSWMCRKPVWLFEQNTILGMANKLMRSRAQKLFTGLPLEKEAQDTVNIGNLVTSSIKKRSQYDPKLPIRLLIMGGSRGARSINQHVPVVLAKHFKGRFQIKHISGHALYDETKAVYSKVGLDADVIDYCHEMPSLYAWADCIIARSGAMTVSEIAMAALPAILIPFPYATDDHQAHNAQVLVDRGGAIMVRSGKDFDVQMTRALEHFVPEHLVQMHQWLYGMDFGVQWHVLENALKEQEQSIAQQS